MLRFWREVHKRLEESIISNRIYIFAEQYFIREILIEKPWKIRCGILPADEYCSPRMGYSPERQIFLSETLRMYHATWTDGVKDKKYHLKQALMLVQNGHLMKRFYFFVSYYGMIFKYRKSFFKGTSKFFREKYQILCKKIDKKRVLRFFS